MGGAVSSIGKAFGGLVGGLLGVEAPPAPPKMEVPKMPEVAPPPPAPTLDTAADNAASTAAKDEEARRLRSGYGRASTILTSISPDEAALPSAKKTLLGQ